jgi:hypothetical protein
MKFGKITLRRGIQPIGFVDILAGWGFAELKGHEHWLLETSAGVDDLVSVDGVEHELCADGRCADCCSEEFGEHLVVMKSGSVGLD